MCNMFKKFNIFEMFEMYRALSLTAQAEPANAKWLQYLQFYKEVNFACRMLEM